MKASFFLACGAVVLATVACAASGINDETAPSPDAGGGDAVIADAAVAESDADAESAAERPQCSAAGWCATSLPDTDLSMKDIWPLPGRAFAVAESPTLGVKVLEWDDLVARWKYIDDKSQNDPGFGQYVGKIWAPNENEVYYAVSPGYIYHGKRPVPPETAWSWTRDRLADNSPVDDGDPADGYPSYWKTGANYPALGVWGTSSGDVYAWVTNTIYHRKSVDGGTSEWIAEYVADDSDEPGPHRPFGEHLFFLSAAGTSPDDVWFSGARARLGAGCALVVRKTPAGYKRVADGLLSRMSSACSERPGTLMIGGAEGWLTDVQALAPDQFIGLKGARDVVRISVEGDSYSVALAPVPEAVSPRGLNSLWSGHGDVWLSGWGRVVRGANVWDGGAYQISTTSLSGGPLNRPMYQIRGTSNTNLWAIGVRHALHKTTP